MAKGMVTAMTEYSNAFFNCTRRKLIVIALILLVIYLPVFSADYVLFDEYKEILENNLILAPLSFSGLYEIFTSFEANQYTPLSILSFWIEYNFFGFNSAVSHSVNLFLHILGTCCVLCLLNLLLGPGKTAFFVALIWGIHPLQVESVAWVLERRNLLYGLFYFSSILWYLKFSLAPDRKKMTMACLLMILSGLSKTLAFTIPFTWLMLDWLRIRALNMTLIKEKLAAFIIAAFLLWLLLTGARGSITGSGTSMLHWRMASYNICFYLAKAVLPVGLSPTFEIHAATEVAFNYGPVYLILLVILCLAVGRRSRLFTFAMAFYFFHILPLSGLIRVGYNFYAVLHFMYLPLLGVILAVVSLFKDYCISEKFRELRLAIVIILCAAFAFMSYQHSLIWQNTEVLFNHSLKLDPDNRFARNQLAVFFESNARLYEAAVHFQELKNRYPDFFGGHYGLGRVLLKVGEPAAAIIMLDRAAELNNDRPDLPFDRGQTLLLLGRFAEAESNLSRSLELQSSLTGYFLRSEARRHLGRYSDAVEDLEMVIAGAELDLNVRLSKIEILTEKMYLPAALYEFFSMLELSGKTNDFAAQLHKILTSTDLKAAAVRWLPFRGIARSNFGWYPF